jgi:hypothetical protein
LPRSVRVTSWARWRSCSGSCSSSGTRLFDLGHLASLLLGSDSAPGRAANAASRAARSRSPPSPFSGPGSPSALLGRGTAAARARALVAAARTPLSFLMGMPFPAALRRLAGTRAYSSVGVR